MDQIRLRRLARGQLGLFTRDQAIACGVAAQQIRRRVLRGEWKRVTGDVLAPVALPVTDDVRDRAAALAIPGGVLVFASAARVWGMPVADKGVYVSVGRDRCVRVAGVRVMRFPLAATDVTTVDRVPVTDRARTVLDCVRLLAPPAARELLDRALQRGWLTVDALTAFAHTMVGRAGADQVRDLVRGVAAGSRSQAERLAASILRRAGLHGWRLNVAIRDDDGRLLGVGDIVFEADHLVIEVDGWAFHVTPDRFQSDRQRQNALVAAGWTVLRFTWSDLTGRPEAVIATVEAALVRA